MRLPNRYPKYPLADNEKILLGTSSDVAIYWDGSRLIFNPLTGVNFSLVFASGLTRIYGGVAASDDLILHATRDDLRPYMAFYGGSGIKASVSAGSKFEFLDHNTAGLTIGYAANVSTIHGGAVTGDDLELEANTTDTGAAIILEGNGDVAINPAAGSYLKYGAYVSGAATDSTGYILIEDSGGTARKLMVQA